MVEACLPEVRLAKAEVDNSIIIHHLTDALSKDFAQGDVGALDISTVQVKHLTERIEAVEDMGVQTAHAEQLLKAAKIVVRIRTAMVSVCVWECQLPWHFGLDVVHPAICVSAGRARACVLFVCLFIVVAYVGFWGAT